MSSSGVRYASSTKNTRPPGARPFVDERPERGEALRAEHARARNRRRRRRSAGSGRHTNKVGEHEADALVVADPLARDESASPARRRRRSATWRSAEAEASRCPGPQASSSTSPAAEGGGDARALLDRALGVELGGDVGAADEVQPRPWHAAATRSSYSLRTDSWPAQTTTWSTSSTRGAPSTVRCRPASSTRSYVAPLTSRTPDCLSTARCAQPDVLPSPVPIGVVLRCTRVTSRAGVRGLGSVRPPGWSAGSPTPQCASQLVERPRRRRG